MQQPNKDYQAAIVNQILPALSVAATAFKLWTNTGVTPVSISAASLNPGSTALAASAGNVSILGLAIGSAAEPNVIGASICQLTTLAGLVALTDAQMAGAGLNVTEILPGQSLYLFNTASVGAGQTMPAGTQIVVQTGVVS